MKQINAAQQIHQHLGVPIRDEHKQAHGAQNAKTTKSGPGRYHQQGAQKASPIKDKGAPRGFVLHQASQAKRDRRFLVRSIGVRQHKKDLLFVRLAKANLRPYVPEAA